MDRNGEVALGSFRLDRLDRELASLLQESRVETVSLAPEAGSQRLRDVIRKGITEEDIFRAVELLIEHGIANVRLYFMVGLPSETEADIDAIIGHGQENKTSRNEDFCRKKELQTHNPQHQSVHPETRYAFSVAAS